MTQSRREQAKHGRPHEQQVLAALADLFSEAGWLVEEPSGPPGKATSDLLVRRGDVAYCVELKVSSEGRADRLVPLWAQAYLQAQRATPEGCEPLPIVVAPSISERVLQQVVDFAHRNAPAVALGVIDLHGRRHLEGHSALAELSGHSDLLVKSHTPVRRTTLFTDINQWLLKVLLAPWLPASQTSAPRGEYRNATELAHAAKVSVMSAFRLVEALRTEGHLGENDGVLRVARRRELLERWRAWSASRIPRELPAVFVLPSSPRADLHAVLERSNVGTCLALFAAADALDIGFIRGVPPHVYLPRLTSVAVGNLHQVVVAATGEQPHLLLREAPAPRSVFRCAVPTKSGLATDVLQTWLDVSAHPSRGREQADVIERRVLARLLEDE